MYWLSEPADTLAALAAEGAAVADVVVVGSGYGGAVAALRFAEAGHRVFLLERGDEYLAGEFPNDLSQAGRHVRAEIAGGNGTRALGYEAALFDFRLGEQAGALVGNGLGGGSLINAAVALEPDPRVFRQPQWPQALRREEMGPWFERARRQLEVDPPPAALPPTDLRATVRLERLRELARAAAAKPAGADAGRVAVRCAPVPLAIGQQDAAEHPLGPRQACLGCGDCVTGCNHDAKLSVAKTYLPAAVRAGARLFTGATVLEIVPAEDDALHPWRVQWVPTGERRLQHALEDAGSAPETGWLHQLRAAHVVLAAGTFGSTEILLRSRERGLALSPRLGEGFSGNGDDLSFGYDLREPTAGQGQGAGAMPALRPGPTICGVVHFDDRDDVRRSTLVEDGAAPGLLGPVFSELLATLGIAAEIGGYTTRTGGGDPLVPQPQVLARSMPLLGMGHDEGRGRLQLDAASDRLRWGWAGAAQDSANARHAQRLAAIAALGGVHLGNPAHSVLPAGVADFATGPAAGGSIFTVHPLGGCCMGDSPADGVVNHYGAVWNEDGSLHDGLWVMDGSVLPGSLGVNPLLTITALAERSCQRVLGELPSRPAPVARELPPLPRRPQPLSLPVPVRAGGSLSEVLRGTLQLQEPLAGLPAVPAAAALYLRMEVDDWRAWAADPLHRARVRPGGQPALGGPPRLRLEAGGQALVFHVAGGSVDVFRRVEDGRLRHAERSLRVVLTYFLARWWPELARPAQGPRWTPSRMWRVLRFGWRVAVLGGELRRFDYQLPLQGPAGSTWALRASKRIETPATWRALGACLREVLRGHRPAPRRRSFLEQLTELDVELLQDGRRVATGRLALDLEEVLRTMLPQLGPEGDLLQAAAGLAAFPLMLVRGIVRSRILDFRAPDYRADRPQKDPALEPRPDGFFELAQPENRSPPLNSVRGPVQPQPAVRLDVRASHRGPASDTVRIGLVRFRQDAVQVQLDGATGRARARSIVLMNGFAQSTRTFVAPELGTGALASMLYDAGWDVWLLEYRVSPLLDASARFSTMDDIAAFDLPAAFDHVAQVVAEEGRARGLPLDADRLQLFAFSHCVGSAALAMSLLGGHLALPGAPSSGPQPVPGRLAGVLFSQFLPRTVGSRSAQQRLQLASFLHNVMGRDQLDFAAATVQPDLLHALLDRVFATLPVAEDELCPHEHDLRREQPDTTSCKRMGGLLSRLFTHRQLLPETHDKLDWYFGRANLGVFLHGARCVDAERLVNDQGQNAYLTAANLRRHLQLPVLLLHGERNVLFDADSLALSREALQALGGGAGVETLLVPDHAHFDCTIGREAPQRIFPRLLDFFDRAFHAQARPAPRAAALQAQLPRTGPIAGWVRPGARGETLVRVWAELDNDGSEPPAAGCTELRYRLHGAWQRVFHGWPVRRQQLHAGNAPDLAMPAARCAGRAADIVTCLADLSLPAGASDVRVRFFGLHGGALAAMDCGVDGDVVPAARLRPLDAAPLPPAIDAALDTLRGELQLRRETAGRAEPGTLSRTRRTVRDFDACELRLGAAQLAPPADGTLRFLAAGCRHPGVTGFEQERMDASLQAIAGSAQAQEAACMFMLGDQVYIDARAGVFDSAWPVERLVPRYRQAFGSPGFRAVAGQLPLAMVADDHELEDGWSAEFRDAGPVHAAVADNAAALFRSFQRSHGPDLDGLGGLGHDYALERGGVAFLALDTRFGRRRLPQPQLLRPQGWTRLERWLRQQAQRPGPKFILTGTVMAPGLVSGRDGVPPPGTDNWQTFPAERARLLRMVRDTGVRNLVFVSCDYHCAGVAAIRWDGEQEPAAWAVIAPPLHAPLRFANTGAQELLPQEHVAVPGGPGAQVQLLQGWDGQGWLQCDLQPLAQDAGWELQLTWHLRALHDAAPLAARWNIVMPPVCATEPEPTQ